MASRQYAQLAIRAPRMNGSSASSGAASTQKHAATPRLPKMREIESAEARNPSSKQKLTVFTTIARRSCESIRARDESLRPSPAQAAHARLRRWRRRPNEPRAFRASPHSRRARKERTAVQAQQCCALQLE